MSLPDVVPSDSLSTSVSSSSPLRIAVLGSARFGAGEPFAGGLESHTMSVVRALQRAGHRVTLFAGPADEPAPADIDLVPIVASRPDFRGLERPDHEMSSESASRMEAGYRRVLDEVGDRSRFDVIHNNSLHYLPVIYDGHVDVAMVHVLHCPPFEELTTAYRIRRETNDPGRLGDVISVSHSLARAWRGVWTSVILNGVPVDEWGRSFTTDPTSRCVWAGRIVEEKAPHLAIDAARRAGREIVLAGPVQHERYFDECIRPRLGPDAVWAGHLEHHDLVELFSTSAVGVVTPQWEEPFGLVVAEILACGTPIAAFDRGAIRSLLTPEVGRLAVPDDVVDLAAAIDAAAVLDRRHCRMHARRRLSQERMIAEYVTLYRAAIARSGAPTKHDPTHDLVAM